MFGFAILVAGLVLIVLWLRHDSKKPWTPSGKLSWKEILMIFLAFVVILIVGIIRSSVFI
jgi:hypothetical protein